MMKSISISHDAAKVKGIFDLTKEKLKIKQKSPFQCYRI